MARKVLVLHNEGAAGSNGRIEQSAGQFLETTDPITNIQGRDVDSTAPIDGQALVWDAGTSRWKPGAGGARTFGWGVTGTPIAGVVSVPVYTADVNMTLSAVSLIAGTAPTGSAFDVDIERWNGSTWATVFSTRPTIAAGQTRGGSGAVLSITSITAGQELRVNVIAVNGATNVTIQLHASASA